MGVRRADGNVAGTSGAVVSGYPGPWFGHYTSASIVAGVVARYGPGALLRTVPGVKPTEWAFEMTWKEADLPS